MGIFSNFFKNKQNPQTATINTTISPAYSAPQKIAEGLQLLREHWYSQMVLRIRTNFHNLTIRNPILGGNGDLAANVYQLIWTCWFVSNEGYVTSNSGQAFTDLMYFKLIQVHGNSKLFELITRYRYRAKEDKIITDDFIFCNDVMSFMLGSENSSFDANMAVNASLWNFRELIFIGIADAFGDPQTVLKHQKKLET